MSVTFFLRTPMFEKTVHDMYLVRVKTPEESKGEFDLFEIVDTIPGDEAYQPMDPSTCKLLQD